MGYKVLSVSISLNSLANNGNYVRSSAIANDAGYTTLALALSLSAQASVRDDNAAVLFQVYSDIENTNEEMSGYGQPDGSYLSAVMQFDATAGARTCVVWGIPITRFDFFVGVRNMTGAAFSSGNALKALLYHEQVFYG